jgi:hypothetical protein
MLARGRILQRLWDEFGKKPTLFESARQSVIFKASDVTELLPDPDFVPHHNNEEGKAEQATAEQLAADLCTVAGRKFSHRPEGVAKVLKNHVSGWVNLGDIGTLRLMSYVDPDTRGHIFYIDNKQA